MKVKKEKLKFMIIVEINWKRDVLYNGLFIWLIKWNKIRFLFYSMNIKMSFRWIEDLYGIFIEFLKDDRYVYLWFWREEKIF